MAGASVTITVDDAEVPALFARVVAFGENVVHDAGASIGEYMMRSTRERAAREESPDGVPSVNLSPKYAKRKERKRHGVPMLRYDGHLLGDALDYQVGEGVA